MDRLGEIIAKALAEQELKPAEIQYLLSISEREEQEKIFAAARRIRGRYFGSKIFAYGFVYFSTYCRNDCRFCYYRRSNPHSPRYRKEPEEILEISRALADSGVHLLDLTMGEDPFYYQKQDFSDLLELVRAIKSETGLPLMASFGLWPEEMLAELFQAGADWYACYQETHNPELYRQLRINQDFQARLELKRQARRQGFLVEDGILLGVGENNKDRADSILTMKELNVDQGRVMSFIPQQGTPLEQEKTPPREQEMLVIAVLRLVLKDSLVPASLDVDGIGGLKDRLKAGANVVTSLIPPASGLKGVSNSRLDIEEGHRTIAGVKKILKDTRLELAALSDYTGWLESRKEGENSAGDSSYRRWTAGN